MYLGAQAEANKLHVNLDFNGNPNQYSPSTQLPYLQSMFALHPSVAVIAPTDTKALEPEINKFVKSGIPVLNVDSGDANQKNITSWITGNNKQGGELAAKELASAMGDTAPYTSGTYNVVIGVSSLTTSTDAARVSGFKAALASTYKNLKIIDTFETQSDSTTADSDFATLIAGHAPGEGASNLAGVFAIDGTDASGAIAAINSKSEQGKVSLVGFDAYASVVAQLYNVTTDPKGPVTALIAQQPYLEGQLAVKYAVERVQHKNSKGIPHLDTLANELLTGSASAATLTKYTYQSS
jgi:ribose transport system substrate-binding protein